MLPAESMQKFQSKDEFSGLRCVIYEGIIIERDNFIVLKTRVGRLDAACSGNQRHRELSKTFDRGSFGLGSVTSCCSWTGRWNSCIFGREVEPCESGLGLMLKNGGRWTA